MIWGGLRRCSICRTSIAEYPVECPHGLPFCEHCTWEEACAECAPPAVNLRVAS